MTEESDTDPLSVEIEQGVNSEKSLAYIQQLRLEESWGEVRDDLTTFFILAFIIAWLIWLPSLLASLNFVSIPEWYGLVSGLATFSPMIAAFYLIRKSQGKGAIKQFWSKGWKTPFNPIWLLPVLLISPITSFAALRMAEAVSGEQGQIQFNPIAILFILIVGGPLGEEFGWRGYALKKLQLRYNAFSSSLILGSLWSLWHLPLHFINGSTQSYIPIWALFILNTTSSLIYTWIFNNTHGSVAVVILLHWVGNVSSFTFPFWQIGLIANRQPNLWIPTYGMLILYGMRLVITLFVLKLWRFDTLQRL